MLSIFLNIYSFSLPAYTLLSPTFYGLLTINTFLPNIVIASFLSIPFLLTIDSLQLSTFSSLRQNSRAQRGRIGNKRASPMGLHPHLSLSKRKYRHIQGTNHLRKTKVPDSLTVLRIPAQTHSVSEASFPF